AHMWFGDLVTMKWWNGIWLNEAFATFMELLCVDSFRPDWKRWDAFATERAAALRIDGLEATRPVEIAVARPEEADAMFDVLTYQKGSSVVRMLEQYLGASEFREGLRLYMRRHAYGNTETTDLWDAIEEASGEPARSIMDSWIYQGGYPLVSVTPVAADRVRLTQQRFRYGGGADATWQVPVRVRHAAGEERVVLGDEPVELTVSADGPVVVNAGGWGFFRVRYEGELRGRIAAGLASLSALERYNLLSDAWAAALAGAAPAAEAIDLMRAYGGETDPATWQLILGIAKTLRRVAPEDAVAAFVQQLAGPAAERFGWDATDGEDATAGTSRGLVLELLGNVGKDTRVIDESRRRVEAAASDPTALPGDVRRAALQTIARDGNEADLTKLLEGMRTASTPQDETQYRSALAELTHPALVRRVCDLCLTEIRSQDVSPVLMLLLAGAHPLVAWEWVEENWETLLERLPSNLVSRIVLGVVETVDPTLAARIRAFLETHPIPVGGATVRQYLELMDTHVAFAGRESAALVSALRS
ncbi:MAG TPA: ERAP1-like C-terminal domain-containing protein, partial [Acidimicrobiales bacterium]|nr:ERAP1-like C-terminal domain-containing protein [Acidimicrobiales bacterium]